MLSHIGEAPLDSLENGVLHADGAQALQILRRVSKKVQEEGWFFNTEENYQLIPEVATKEIRVGDNVLSVDTKNIRDNVTLRGNRLYNMTKHTYQFENPISVTVIIQLPFDELPEVAKDLIIVVASRRFQAEAVGSDTLNALSEQQEYTARADLLREHVRNLGNNFSDHTLNSTFGTDAVQRINRRCL